MEAALCAPSGDNVQPFLVHFRGDSVVAISLNSQVPEHPLDVGRVTTLIALGALLETIKFAATGFDLKAQFQLTKTAGVSDDWALIDFTNAAPNDPEIKNRKAFLPMLKERVTDRRSFSRQAVDPALVAKICADTEGDVAVSFVPTINDELKSAAIRSDQAYLNQPRFSFATARWVQPQSLWRRPRRGLNIWNLGLPVLLALPVLLFRTTESVLRKGMQMGGALMFKLVLQRQLANVGGFLFVHSSKTGAAASVQIGQLGLRAWLQLCSNGYSVQPLTAMTTLPWLARQGRLLQWPPSLQEALQANAKALLYLEAGRAPIAWGFRVGKNSKLSSIARCDRLALDQVVAPPSR